MNIDILNYIKNARNSGMGDDKIKEGLSQSGASALDIDEALKGSGGPEIPLVKPKWHPTKAQKLIAIVGIVLILVMIGAYAYSSYLASKNYNEVVRQAKIAQDASEALKQQRANDPTAGWQTYRNEEYGFEFKHPGDFSIKSSERQYDGLNLKYIFVEASLGEMGSYNNFVVAVSSDISLNDWIQKIEPKSFAGETLVTQQSDITFLGFLAKEWQVFGFDHTNREIIFVKNNVGYSISYESEDPNIPNFEYYKKISDQILSTFRFVD